ncbi:MAG TPA: DNA internalization-related competence protein ComEC/Rec2 [Deltaproteobacteria bacterium]|nr:DNA internalization-related competence protein ComEC/Rec2 [Deltaproteobacteria bacterium]
MKTPLAVICVLFMAGIATGDRWPLPGIMPLLLLPVPVILVPVVCRIGLRRIAAVGVLAAAWFILGFVAAQDSAHLRERPGDDGLIALAAERNYYTMEGYIVENPRVVPAKSRFIVSVTALLDETKRRPVRGTVLLTARNIPDTFRYGDYIRFTARLKKPRNFNNPGGFDYESYLRRRHIALTASVSRPIDIVILRRGGGNPLTATIETLRSRVRNLIADATQPPLRELLGALVLGEKERIHPDMRERFNRAGVAHLLAISGFHVGMAAFFTFLAVRAIMSLNSVLLLKMNLQKVSALFAIPVVLFYAFMAGFGVSTQRAVIMIAVFACALLLSRSNNLLNALAMAAIIILVLVPSSLFDISFQLSFIAVAAILMVLPRVRPFPAVLEKNRIARGIVLFIVVTVAASLATAPVIAYSFNRVSTVALIANLLVVPLIGFGVLPAGIAAALAAPFFPGLSLFLFKASAVVLAPALSIISTLADLSWSGVHLSTPGLPGICCFYGSFWLALKCIDTLRNGSNRRLPAAVAAACLVVALCGIAHGRYLDRIGIPSGVLEVTFLDVGQGNSAVVVFPDRRIMLVDGGGFFDPAFDVGKNIVGPYLRRRRIRTVDVVVLTHPDQDHIGGLPFILETFNIGEVWSNGEANSSESYRRFAGIIERKNIFHEVMWSGTDDHVFGGAVVRILHPDRPCRTGKIQPEDHDFNARGLVFEIRFGDTGFLFTSDIPGETEALLVQRYGSLKNTVLQAPHHGSGLSSSPGFLDAVKADIAVVSAGFDNPFGFPRSDVIKRYEKAGTSLYRTDLDGAVTVSSDGRRVRVIPFLSKDSSRPD